MKGARKRHEPCGFPVLYLGGRNEGHGTQEQVANKAFLKYTTRQSRCMAGQIGGAEAQRDLVRKCEMNTKKVGF